MRLNDESMTLGENNDQSGTVRAFPAPAHKTDAPTTDRAPAAPHAERYVEAEAPAGPVEAPAAPAAAKGSRRKLLMPVIGAVVLAAGAYYGYDYWTVGRFMVSTDDAYLTADIAAIAPKIQGYVDQIDFKENQRVKAGDVLLKLDDGDYRIAVDQANAAIASQQKTLARIEAQEKAAEASVDQALAQKRAAEATAKNAKATAVRARSLLKTKFAAQSEVDNANAALASANANLAGAEAQVAAAKANVDVLKAQYVEAQSQVRTLQLNLAQAKRNLAQTVLRAPYDGVVSNRSIERGELVSPGQKLAAVVPTRSLYVEANLKETQLAHVVPGEKAEVSIDALDGKTVEGTVVSLSPASGSVFSLLPPENATGNFTKVVQRVPVRIKLPESLVESGKLHAGLSVVVDIDTRTAPHETAAR